MFTGFKSVKPSDGMDSNFNGSAPYFYGFILLFAVVSSYIVVNKGLKHFDSVYVAPLFKIAGMLHNLMTGGIVLNEFREYTHNPTKFAGFLGGIGI